MTTQEQQHNKNKALETIRDYREELNAARPSILLSKGRLPKGQNTLRQILQATRGIFEQESYAGLTFRKVADRADLSVGNVNYYFTSKQRLVDAALVETLANYIDQHIDVLTESDDDPLEILLNVVSFYVRHGATSNRLFAQIWSYASSSDEARDKIRDYYRPIGRFMYFLVRAANPEFSHLDARQAVLQIFSLEQGVRFFFCVGPRDDIALATAETAVRDAVRMMVTGAGAGLTDASSASPPFAVDPANRNMKDTDQDED